MKVKIKLSSELAKMPEYKSAGASGMDICSIESVDLLSGDTKVVKTGLHLDIPQGYEVQVRPRSGLAAKNGITVLNSPGTIDCDYRGELMVIITNLGKSTFSINAGDRIAQIVVCPVVQAELEQVDVLSDTIRGEGGLGSTGVK